MAFVDYPITVDPDLLVAQSLDQLRSVTGAALNEGHPLVALLEVIAYRNAETRIITADVGRAAFRDFGLKVYGVVQLTAVAATATVQLTVTNTDGYTIPAGAVVAYPTSGSSSVGFATDDDLVIPAASTTGTVGVTALVTGDAVNGLAPASLTLVDVPVYVTAAATTTTTSGGVDEESDDDYVDRLVEEIRSSSTGGLVLPADFATAARRIQGVHRAIVIPGYDPGRVVTDGVTTDTDATVTSATAAFTADDVGRTVVGAGIPGAATVASINSATSIELSAPATATATGVTLTFGVLTNLDRTVYIGVADEDGADVSVGLLTEVVEEVEARREINFIARAGNPDRTAIAVVFTAVALDDFDASDVEAAAVAAVEAYLSPATWGGGGESPPQWRDEVVRYLEVAAVINAVTGVDYVATLTLNAGTADITLDGVAPLPTPTVTGTVT